MTIRLLTLASNGDPTAEHRFPFVEDAIAWATQDRGELLQQDDEGRFGLEFMTPAESNRLDETGEYPPLRYCLTGLDDDDTDRELEDGDWRDHDGITG